MVLETQASRNLAGLLSLGLIVLLIAFCLMIYLFREKLFSAAIEQVAPPAHSASHAADQSKELFLRAVQTLGNRQTDKALAAFDRLSTLTGNAQPMGNWIRMNGALAMLMTGKEKEAAQRFEQVEKGGIYSIENNDRILASFFVGASKQLSKAQRIPSSITRLYSNATFEAFGLLCFGLHDWAIGDFENASLILESFLDGKVTEPDAWIETYKALAADYHFDANLLVPIERALPEALDAAAAQALLEKVRNARGSLRIGGSATARLEAIERQLTAGNAHAKAH